MLLTLPAGHGWIYAIVEYSIGIILLALLIRMIASWVRLDDRYPFIRFLARLTDPFISPVRRLVPPVGIFDMSWFISFFLLITLQVLLLQALPIGW